MSKSSKTPKTPPKKLTAEMVSVLQEIAADQEQPATARVAAAKSILLSQQAQKAERGDPATKAQEALAALLAPPPEDLGGVSPAELNLPPLPGPPSD